jgi:hypothetical protein
MANWDSYYSTYAILQVGANTFGKNSVKIVTKLNVYSTLTTGPTLYKDSENWITFRPYVYSSRIRVQVYWCVNGTMIFTSYIEPQGTSAFTSNLHYISAGQFGLELVIEFDLEAKTIDFTYRCIDSETGFGLFSGTPRDMSAYVPESFTFAEHYTGIMAPDTTYTLNSYGWTYTEPLRSTSESYRSHRDWYENIEFYGKGDPTIIGATQLDCESSLTCAPFGVDISGAITISTLDDALLQATGDYNNTLEYLEITHASVVEITSNPFLSITEAPITGATDQNIYPIEANKNYAVKFVVSNPGTNTQTYPNLAMQLKAVRENSGVFTPISLSTWSDGQDNLVSSLNGYGYTGSYFYRLPSSNYNDIEARLIFLAKRDGAQSVVDVDADHVIARIGLHFVLWNKTTETYLGAIQLKFCNPNNPSAGDPAHAGINLLPNGDWVAAATFATGELEFYTFTTANLMTGFGYISTPGYRADCDVTGTVNNIGGTRVNIDSGLPGTSTYIRLVIGFNNGSYIVAFKEDVNVDVVWISDDYGSSWSTTTGGTFETACILGSTDTEGKQDGVFVEDESGNQYYAFGCPNDSTWYFIKDDFTATSKYVPSAGFILYKNKAKSTATAIAGITLYASIHKTVITYNDVTFPEGTSIPIVLFGAHHEVATDNQGVYDHQVRVYNNGGTGWNKSTWNNFSVASVTYSEDGELLAMATVRVVSNTSVSNLSATLRWDTLKIVSEDLSNNDASDPDVDNNIVFRGLGSSKNKLVFCCHRSYSSGDYLWPHAMVVVNPNSESGRPDFFDRVLFANKTKGTGTSPLYVENYVSDGINIPVYRPMDPIAPGEEVELTYIIHCHEDVAGSIIHFYLDNHSLLGFVANNYRTTNLIPLDCGTDANGYLTSDSNNAIVWNTQYHQDDVGYPLIWSADYIQPYSGASYGSFAWLTSSVTNGLTREAGWYAEPTFNNVPYVSPVIGLTLSDYVYLDAANQMYSGDIVWKIDGVNNKTNLRPMYQYKWNQVGTTNYSYPYVDLLPLRNNSGTNTSVQYGFFIRYYLTRAFGSKPPEVHVYHSGVHSTLRTTTNIFDWDRSYQVSVASGGFTHVRMNGQSALSATGSTNVLTGVLGATQLDCITEISPTGDFFGNEVLGAFNRGGTCGISPNATQWFLLKAETNLGGVCSITNANAVINQVFIDVIAYRVRNDDGDESTATWAAPLNTMPTLLPNTTYRIRFAIKNTDPVNNRYLAPIWLDYAINSPDGKVGFMPAGLQHHAVYAPAYQYDFVRTVAMNTQGLDSTKVALITTWYKYIDSGLSVIGGTYDGTDNDHFFFARSLDNCVTFDKSHDAGGSNTHNWMKSFIGAKNWETDDAKVAEVTNGDGATFISGLKTTDNFATTTASSGVWWHASPIYLPLFGYCWGQVAYHDPTNVTGEKYMAWACTFGSGSTGSDVFPATGLQGSPTAYIDDTGRVPYIVKNTYVSGTDQKAYTEVSGASIRLVKDHVILMSTDSSPYYTAYSLCGATQNHFASCPADGTGTISISSYLQNMIYPKCSSLTYGGIIFWPNIAQICIHPLNPVDNSAGIAYYISFPKSPTNDWYNLDCSCYFRASTTTGTLDLDYAGDTWGTPNRNRFTRPVDNHHDETYDNYQEATYVPFYAPDYAARELGDRQYVGGRVFTSGTLTHPGLGWQCAGVPKINEYKGDYNPTLNELLYIEPGTNPFDLDVYSFKNSSEMYQDPTDGDLGFGLFSTTQQISSGAFDASQSFVSTDTHGLNVGVNLGAGDTIEVEFSFRLKENGLNATGHDPIVVQDGDKITFRPYVDGFEQYILNSSALAIYTIVSPKTTLNCVASVAATGSIDAGKCQLECVCTLTPTAPRIEGTATLGCIGSVVPHASLSFYAQIDPMNGVCTMTTKAYITRLAATSLTIEVDASIDSLCLVPASTLLEITGSDLTAEGSIDVYAYAKLLTRAYTNIFGRLTKPAQIDLYCVGYATDIGHIGWKADVLAEGIDLNIQSCKPELTIVKDNPLKLVQNVPEITAKKCSNPVKISQKQLELDIFGMCKAS